jgi:hypothetical protein
MPSLRILKSTYDFNFFSFTNEFLLNVIWVDFYICQTFFVNTSQAVKLRP